MMSREDLFLDDEPLLIIKKKNLPFSNAFRLEKESPQQTQMLGNECPLLFKSGIAALEEHGYSAAGLQNSSSRHILQIPSCASFQVKVIILRRNRFQNPGSPHGDALTWAEL